MLFLLLKQKTDMKGRMLKEFSYVKNYFQFFSKRKL